MTNNQPDKQQDWQPIETAPRDGTEIEIKTAIGIEAVRFRDHHGRGDKGWRNSLGQMWVPKVWRPRPTTPPTTQAGEE